MGNEIIGHHFKEINENMKNILGKNFNLFDIKVKDDAGTEYDLETIIRIGDANHNNHEYFDNSWLLVKLSHELIQRKIIAQSHVREAVLLKKNIEILQDMIFDKLNLKAEKTLTVLPQFPEERKPAEPPKFSEKEDEYEPEEDDFIIEEEENAA